MNVTTEDLGTGAAIVAAVIVALSGMLKVLQWLFTDRAKVAVIESKLEGIEKKIDEIQDTLKKGSARMTGHDEHIGDLRERLGTIEGGRHD